MTTPARLSVASTFAEFCDELMLTWVSGQNWGDRLITREVTSGKRPRLVGTFNFNSPNRIQLIGPAEARLFSDVTELTPARFEYVLASSCELFVMSDSLPPPPSVTALADAATIPIFTSELPYSELHKSIRRRLMKRLAKKQIIHGVMMDVHGTGVLITGNASVGKSELALELISRGHILVADDAPEFTRIAPGTLESRCPPLLQDFLEVRGLGVLNIARMYGEAHTRSRKILRFIVHLQAVSTNNQTAGSHDFNDLLADVGSDRLGEPDVQRMILGEAISARTIPVAPGRNLAVLVEAAVSDYILRAGGYSASRDLVEKQSRAMAQR